MWWNFFFFRMGRLLISETERGRQTHRETERERDGKRERSKDRERGTQTHWEMV